MGRSFLIFVYTSLFCVHSSYHILFIFSFHILYLVLIILHHIFFGFFAFSIVYFNLFRLFFIYFSTSVLIHYRYSYIYIISSLLSFIVLFFSYFTVIINRVCLRLSSCHCCSVCYPSWSVSFFIGIIFGVFYFLAFFHHVLYLFCLSCHLYVSHCSVM